MRLGFRVCPRNGVRVKGQPLQTPYSPHPAPCPPALAQANLQDPYQLQGFQGPERVDMNAGSGLNLSAVGADGLPAFLGTPSIPAVPSPQQMQAMYMAAAAMFPYYAQQQGMQSFQAAMQAASVGYPGMMAYPGMAGVGYPMGYPMMPGMMPGAMMGMMGGQMPGAGPPFPLPPGGYPPGGVMPPPFPAEYAQYYQKLMEAQASAMGIPAGGGAPLSGPPGKEHDGSGGHDGADGRDNRGNRGNSSPGRGNNNGGRGGDRGGDQPLGGGGGGGREPQAERGRRCGSGRRGAGWAPRAQLRQQQQQRPRDAEGQRGGA